MSDVTSSRKAVVQLDLELGSFELGVGECRELIRCLDRCGERANSACARALARRLESHLESGDPTETISEAELDSIADAAWDWLERDGLDRFPERVLLLLDVVRARRAHD